MDMFIFSGRLASSAERGTLYRGLRRGRFVRVAAGAATTAAAWNELSPEAKHRARVRALQVLHPETVFCAVTAALVWQRPLLGRPPEKPQAFASGPRNGGSSPSFQRFQRIEHIEPLELNGIRVPSLESTLVDVARHAHRHVAVAMLDHALSSTAGEWPESARTTKGALLDELEQGWSRGASRARAVVDLATALSGSPGETWCRMVIAELGFPAPVLQAAHHDDDGLIGFTDLFWPEFGVVLEFDGVAKYVRSDYTKGRDSHEIVVAEKRRENRLRALGYLVIRLEWRDLRTPERVRASLLKAGVRLTGSRQPDWLR